ncbi:hypothetical protein ACFCYB_42175 [Streptomyces sp. NPDC056309]|uniref:hypothetical protein n=1 Tax=unclassified Streptomyces TaxID=2593676 RepID=UPI0035E2D8DD
MTAPQAVADDPAITFRVTLQFCKDGPSSSGWWSDPAIAERKITEWVGTYGSLDQVIIQLVEEQGGGQETVVKTWTKESAETA